MANKARPRRLAPHERLTPDQEGELVGTLHAIRCTKHGPAVTLAFESMESKERAWFAHRDRLMAKFAGTDTRPAGWWILEAGEPYAPVEQAERLEALGELTDEDRKTLAERDTWMREYQRGMSK